MDTSHTHHKHLLLYWWPHYLVGPTQGGMFVETFEQALWTCHGVDEWQDLLRQMESIWGESAEHTLTRQWGQSNIHPLRDHFGVEAGDALQQLFQRRGPEATWATHPPIRQTSTEETKELAQRVAEQFGLVGVHTDRSSENAWVLRQLLDMQMGFANLATMLKIPHQSIGRGEWQMWLHQHSTHRHSTLGGMHCDIHMGGGDLARSWMQWALGRMPRDATHHLFDEWRASWGQSPRHSVERQQHFLHMQKRKFRNLLNQTDITSDFGERATRRYKAFCKWVDDVERGMQFEQNLQAWQKVKTGNRIAWAGDGIDKHVVQAWQLVEKQVEESFFTKADWTKPAWVRHGDISSDHARAYWGVMFEAFVRDHMGYDSWLAMERSNHPLGQEAGKSHLFLERHVLPMLKS